MNKEKPAYIEPKKRLSETEERLVRLQKNKIKFKNREHYTAIMSTKELAEAYIASEQNFKNSIDTCPMGIRIVTEDGVLIYANKAALDIFGYHTVEELALVKKQELYTPESYAAHLERRRKRKLKQDIQDEYEISIKRPDGEIRNLMVFRREVMWGGEKQYMAMYEDITERKKAEESLRESEDKYHNLIEHSNDGIVFIEEGLIRYCNAKLLEMSGYTREELYGRLVFDFIAPEHKEKVIEAYRKRVAGLKVPEIYEADILSKSGDIIHTEINARLFYFRQKLVDIAIVRDITERKKIDKALRESEREKAAILNGSLELITYQDRELRLIWVNKAAGESVGVSPEKLVGRHCYEVWQNRSEPCVGCPVAKCLETGHPQQAEMPTPDGRIWFVRGYPVRDEKGNVIAATEITLEITERKKAEEELKESQEMFKLAFRDSPNLMLITTLDEGRIIEVNDTYCRTTGYTREELIGHTTLELNLWEDPEQRRAILESLKDKEAVTNAEVKVRAKSGKIQTAYLSMSKITIKNEPYLISIAVDITEKKQAEEELKSRERFLDNIIEKTPNAIWVSDEKGTIIRINQAFRNTLLLTDEEIIGKYNVLKDSQIIEQGFLPLIKCVYEEGKTISFTLDYQTAKEKQIKPALTTHKVLEIVMSAIKNEKGKVINVICQMKDITEQKKAEKALQESEAKFRLIFENSKDAILLTSPDGEILMANTEACRMFGRTEEEICRIGRGGIIDASDPRLELALEKRRLTGEFSGELTGIRADGSKFPIDVSSRLFKDRDGKLRTSMIIRDISERKKLEEALEAEREEVKLIIDSTPILVFYKDLEGKFLRVNKAFASALNMTEEDMLGKTVFDLYSRNIAEGMTNDDNEVFKTRRPKLNIIEQYESASGLRWVQTDKIPIFNKDGKVIGLVGFAQDITEQKRAEEAVKESEEKYRLISENVPVVVYSALPDEYSTSLFISGRAKELTGYSSKELIENREIFNKMVHPEDSAYVWQKILEHRRNKTILDVEYRIITKEGNIKWIRDKATPALDENGEIIMIDGFMEDITERKAAEEKLAFSETRYRRLFESAKDGILILNAGTGEIVDVNPFLFNMLGYSKEELIGKKLWEIGLFKDIVASKEAFLKLQDKGYIRYDDLPLRTKDGHKRDVEFVSNVYQVNSNKVIQCNIRDITERKRAEEAVKESEERFNKAFQASPNLMAILTLEEGRFIDVNAEHTRITGYERREVIGKTTLELNLWAHPEKRKEFYQIINTEGRLKDYELLMRTKTGDMRTLLFSAEKIILRGINCIVVSGLDITERKEAEERINHLNLMLRSIRNVSQIITREKDRSLLIQKICDSLVESQSFRSAWIVLLDEKQQPAIWAGANVTKGFPDLIELMKQGKLPRCVQKALKQKQVVITEDRQTICKDCPALGMESDIGDMTIRLEIEGKIYGALSTSIPNKLINDKQEVSLFMEIANDIAFALRDIELVAANEVREQERLRMAKMESIGMLAGGIAHDFNNLLTGIMGNIGLVKTYISNSDPTFMMLDEAEKAAVRARDLTQQLLTFAKGGKPVKKLINTAEIIKESAEFALRGSKIKLIISFPENLWQIEADEGQIHQMINNLVINADEAMPMGGTLTITAENMVLKKSDALPLKSGNYIRIDIKDTGIGISPGHIQRIFEPYFTTKQKGSGLGLTTAYSIVKNHGGIILAESHQNEGSTFRVYLPATKKALKGAKKSMADEPGQAGGKVLIMDDEEIIRKMLKNMLSMAGYTVELSADGAEALDKYKQAKEARDPFNAVIMDLTIPGGMGGKETMKKLLEIDPKATVIVSSGYATDPIMSDYKKYGFKAVIAKPYSVRQLRELLSSLLTKKKR